MPLVFFCGCDRCRAAAHAIALQQRKGRLRNLCLVVALVPEAAQEFQRQSGVKGVILPDPTERVAGLYQSSYCPRFWVISASGLILLRSNMGIDEDKLSATLKNVVNKTDSV